MGRRADLDVVAVEKPCPYRESNLCRLAQLVTTLTYLSRIHALIHIKISDSLLPGKYSAESQGFVHFRFVASVLCVGTM